MVDKSLLKMWDVWEPKFRNWLEIQEKNICDNMNFTGVMIIPGGHEVKCKATDLRCDVNLCPLFEINEIHIKSFLKRGTI